MNEHKQLYLVIVVLSFALGLALTIQVHEQEVNNKSYKKLLLAYDTLEQQNQTLKQLTVNPLNFVIKATDTVKFGAEIYTFESEQRRERLQREVSFLLDKPNFIILAWLVSGRYFPLYDSAAVGLGTTIDLKYASIIESGLDPEVVSWAKAVGLWQFMVALARAYNIAVHEGYDMRRDPELSTQKACEHLNSLHIAYNSWPLALACYNYGESKVINAIKHQGTTDFFKLKLPSETKRYVYFIFAMKLIFENPDRFLPGLISVPKYQPFKASAKVKLVYAKRSYVKDMAKTLNIDIEQLYECNPSLTKDIVIPGEYVINIPFGHKINQN